MPLNFAWDSVGAATATFFISINSTNSFMDVGTSNFLYVSFQKCYVIVEVSPAACMKALEPQLDIAWKADTFEREINPVV